MEIKIEEKRKIIVIRICGELDHHSATMAKNRIEEFIESRGIYDLVFDFLNLSFMDSSGIGLLVGRHKLVSPLGGKVCVIAEGGSIGRILKMSGVEKMIKIFEDEKSALKAINGGM